MNMLLPNDVFGLVKTNIDAHTLGISTVSNLLRQCGYKTVISNKIISNAVENIRRLNNFGILKKWIYENEITNIGFSFRLDPQSGKEYFLEIFYQLKNNNMFTKDGGKINSIFFAGLPETCNLIKQSLKEIIVCFPGDESPHDCLTLLGVPLEKVTDELLSGNNYDKERINFAKNIIDNGEYIKTFPKNQSNYSNYGLKTDSVIERIINANKNNTLPLIRSHVGPYNDNRIDAINQFVDWTEQLAKSGFLDILSIGTSQLSQSNFNEDWHDMPNGGGVPINNPHEFDMIWKAARPMLVRTYAGTKNVQQLASIYEKHLFNAWHALSFWWFCELDGRGENKLLENLKQHFETVEYIASISKPLEANVPHHFSFRGGDDVTYILSVYLTAKLAKIKGIKYFIVQNMLNTPKHTWGIQDLAKSRVILKLIKNLENNNFKVYFQTRAGLDYFSPDYEKAKVQLAAVTALMDDIEPYNENNPEIVHVVNYSEAINLADPVIINESIKITLFSLEQYRKLRKTNKIEDMTHNNEVNIRYMELLEETTDAINFLEKNISNLYTPEGFFKIFYDGYLNVPFLIDNECIYSNATKHQTQIINGSVKTVDDLGNIYSTTKRFENIYENSKI